MGKLALIALAIFTTVGAYMTLSRQDGVMDASERVSNKQYEVLSRNAALAGFNQAKQALTESFSSQTLSGTADGAEYEVTIDVVGTRAVISALGSVGGARGADIDYTIRGDFAQTLGPPPAEVLPFLDFAVLAEESITLQGNIEGEVEVLGEESSELNANMHTNGSLTVKGNATRIEGFGTYVMSGSGFLDNTFNPNYNPASLPDHDQVEPVEIPVVDIPTWMTNVTAARTSSGPTSLAGNYSDGGTRQNPFVWFIDGDAIVSNDVVMDGYNMLIVNGDVDFHQSLRAGDTGYEGPGESSIAVYASGSVEVHGNRHIEAQVFAGSGYSFASGTPTLRGSLTSGGAVTFAGTPDILYRPASPALISNWQPRETLITMTSYYER